MIAQKEIVALAEVVCAGFCKSAGIAEHCSLKPCDSEPAAGHWSLLARVMRNFVSLLHSQEVLCSIAYKISLSCAHQFGETLRERSSCLVFALTTNSQVKEVPEMREICR